jgi:5-methylcytosine-specific restriction protein A
MPRASKACNVKGCTKLAPPNTGSRCPDHKQQATSNRTGTWGTQRTADPEHRKLRALALERDRNRCQVKGPDCLILGNIGDHIIPVAGGGNPVLLANYQCICGPCHRTKTGREARFLGDKSGKVECPWDDSRHELKLKGAPPPPRPAGGTKRKPAQHDPDQSFQMPRTIGVDHDNDETGWTDFY